MAQSTEYGKVINNMVHAFLRKLAGISKLKITFVSDVSPVQPAMNGIYNNEIINGTKHIIEITFVEDRRSVIRED